MRRAVPPSWALISAWLVAAPVLAQTVSLGGSLGDKALLIIDGTPRTLAVGSAVQGVRLIQVNASEAVVEIQGRRQVLGLGAKQTDLGGTPSPGGGSKIVLNADGAGHFWANGSINGKSVRFLVDTGATFLSMGAAEAERLGIDYQRGQRGVGRTATGQVLAYKVALDSVRIGDVQVYNVDALVTQLPMEQVLLGNSFLTRFQMRRDNDVLVLSKRP